MKKVPKTAITERELKRKLKRVIEEGYSSRRDWAVAHDITPQSVSALFKGTQGPGLQIPEALGYRPVTVYVPVGDEG